MKNTTIGRLSVAALLSASGWCAAQTDSFHLMQIQQVIGGVNGDTTKQAIQLRMRFPFENFVQSGVLKVWDAAGQNPVVIIAPPTSVPNGEGGDTVLFTTASFDASTTPPCVPDFHMTNRIPDSYLAAGRLTWEDGFNTVLWSLAWGGSSYTGPTTGSLTNSATGQFGPPWPGPLPTTGTQALTLQTSFSALGGPNATDYALTSGAAVFTSNLRVNFTVSGGAACYPDCNGDHALNVNDFICFQAAFAASNLALADCNHDNALNVNDFVCFQSAFAAGCSAP